MKKWVASLLVVALLCASLPVSLSESDETIGAVANAIVEEPDDLPVDPFPDEVEVSLPFDAEPVSAGPADAASSDEAAPLADGDALPVPAEALEADEEGLEMPGALESVVIDEPEDALAQIPEGFAGSPVGVAIDADHFPDARLRAYVAGAYDADGDGALSDAERLAVIEFDIANVGRVFSLEGLECFTAIEALRLNGLWLTDVDLSPLAALKTLECENSRLTALDLQGNPLLKALRVSGSPLTALDVSHNAQLAELECSRCRLTELSIGEGSALEALVCDKNDLTSLSLGQASLKLLSCAGNRLASMDISGCPKLIECLQSGERASQAGTVRFAHPDGRALVCDADTRIISGSVALYDPQDALSLASEQISLGVGESWTVLSGRSGITASECAFTSSKPKVAAVSAAGVVKAKKRGSAAIRVTAANGQTATLEVKVLKAPKKVTLSSGKLTLGVSERATLTARLPGGSASRLRWSDSNPGVVQFDGSGALQALTPGKTTLTVKTFNGKKAKCVITVLPEPHRVSFAVPTLTLGAGESFALKPTIEPAGARSRLNYFADDDQIASVSASGSVTARNVGRTTLHAEAYNGVDATLELVVVEAPSSLALNTGSRTMGVGETFQLVPEIPEGSASRFAYKSSKPKIAAVNADGLITAKRAGKAKITVSTYNKKKVTVTVTVKKKPTSIRLNAASIVLGVGQAWTPKVTLSKGAGSGLTWQSDDESVFTVNNNGAVTAREIGTAKLTVATYNGLSARCQVTVKAAPTQLSVNADTVILPVGQKQKLDYTVAAEGYSECADVCGFTSSNPKCVAVSASGELKAVKAGFATVTVRTWNGLTAEVTVKSMGAPKKIELTAPGDRLGVGEQMTFGYRLSPAASMTTVSWRTSNAKLAIINSDGVVTGISEGKVTITGKTHNGLKATFKLTITPGTAPVTGVSLNASRITLKKGEHCLLAAQVQPRDARDRGVTWQSGDPSVVTVKDGIVKAVGVGSALITATANGDSACVAECRVQVTEETGGLALLPDAVTLEAGDSQALQVRIDAADLTMADLEFTSSDAQVAAIDQDGRLTAVGEGTATIRAAAKADASIAAECAVKVVKAASGDFDYVISGGRCSITGYKGPGGSVAVPSRIEGAPVTEISDGAFAGNAAITALTVPEGVESIRGNAFAGSGLREVTLPATLTFIADNAFDGCPIDTAHAPSGSKAFEYGRSRGWFRVSWAPEMKLAVYRGEVFKVVNTPVDPLAYESQVRDTICTSPHGTGKYSGYCLGFANYYVYCLVDNVTKVSLSYARGKYRSSSKLTYATAKYYSANTMMARLYDLLSAGVPQILMVEAITHPGSRHFVTVIGYRASVTRREDLRAKDLLIIDSFDGKVESMDPAIEKVHTRVLFKQDGKYRIEAIKRR